MTTYREVKCPYCDHEFMWKKNSDEWGINRYYRYENEERKFVGEDTACPACSERIVVLEGVFLGVAIEDLDPAIKRVGEII